MKFALVLGLIALSASQMTEAFSLQGVVDDVVNTACAAFSSLTSVGSCSSQFESDLSMPTHRITTNNEDFDKDLEQLRGTMKYCCAVANLKSCIFTQIEKTCGAQAEGQSRSLVRKVIGKNEDTCTGEEVIYQSASPLCWPEPAQYAAVIFLVALLISCCCCCLCKICRK